MIFSKTMKLLVLILAVLMLQVSVAAACMSNHPDSSPEEVIATSIFVGQAKAVKLLSGRTDDGFDYYEANLKPLQAYTKPYDKILTIRWYDTSCSSKYDFKKGRKYEVAVFCGTKNQCAIQKLPEENWVELRKQAPSRKSFDFSAWLCRLKGGEWASYSYNNARPFGCLYAANDFGKECHDNTECAGKCLADVTQDEMFALMNQSLNLPFDNEDVQKSGKCSKWKNPLGCFYEVHKDIVKPLACVQ